MLHSILISGGNKEERFKKALTLRQQLNRLTIKPLNHLTVNNDLDFLLLEPADLSIGIAQIKELKTKLSRKPFQAPYKIVFIASAEKLTTEAQNALLKILEEPPPHTIMILSCPTAEVLLATIQSRCQTINLPAKDQIDLKAAEIKTTLEFLSGLLKQGIGERLLTIQPYLKDRQAAIDFCQKTILALHSTSFSSNLKSFKLLKALNQAHRWLQQNINPKLVMENMVLNW